MSYDSSTVAGNDTALATQYNNLRKDSVHNAGDFAVTTGSSNAYVLSVDAQVTALVAGNVVKFEANHTNTGAATLNVNSIGAVSIKTQKGNELVAGDIVNGGIYYAVYDGTDFMLIGGGSSDMFGDGSDGALSVTSGTTTIDASSANVVEKNYTSISISSGATLDLSNKASDGTVLWLRSVGDVTISGTIDMAEEGGDGGGSNTNGTGGFSLNENAGASTGGGGASNGSNPGAGGGGGASVNNDGADGDDDAPSTGGAGGTKDARGNSSNMYRINKNIYVCCGGGGGGGEDESGEGGSPGAGGAGGGAVVIFCGGELVFDGAIDVSGEAGGNATGSGTADHGGGGGGGGGTAIIVARTITTNTGTMTVAGGAAGQGTRAGSPDGGAGGDGDSLVTNLL